MNPEDCDWSDYWAEALSPSQTKAIHMDMAARDLANSALDISKMDEQELRSQLGVFFPELQKLTRRLREMGIEP